MLPLCLPVRVGCRLHCSRCRKRGLEPLSDSPVLLLCLPVTALLRKLKQQSRESVEDKRPKLLKALKEVNSPHPVSPCSCLHFLSRTRNTQGASFILIHRVYRFLVSEPP